VLAIVRAGLPKVASNNRTTATPEENKAIVGGSLAHFGTLSVNAADKTFTFKIETATFPNWSGTEQKRPFTISGDQLRYTAAAASGGGTATVVWKRDKVGTAGGIRTAVGEVLHSILGYEQRNIRVLL
jgi:hypothetical protein